MHALIADSKLKYGTVQASVYCAHAGRSLEVQPITGNKGPEKK